MSVIIQSMLVYGLTAFFGAGQSAATANPPLEAVPADAAVAYFHAGSQADAAPTGTYGALAAVSVLADLGHRTGLLSQVAPTTRLWLDLIGSASVVLDHAHVITLLDVRADSRADGGHRLAGLHLALILRTGGENAAIEQRIQQLLNVHTNDKDTALLTQTEDGRPRYTIRDRRLPPWASITWGPIGEDYAIAIGDGTFERIVAARQDRSRSLAADPWFAKNFEIAGGRRAILGWYIGFDRLLATEDELLTKKVAGVRQSLRLADVERGLWTVRYDGRAVEVDGVVRRGDRDERRPIADSKFLTKLGHGVIPTDATRYAVIDCNPRALVDALATAYLTARSQKGRKSVLAAWNDAQAKAGVSIDRDILSHLGRFVVIHDYPRHALGLPLMWTILLRVEGDPSALRANIDRLLHSVLKEPAPDCAIQMKQDAEGIWFLHLGIQGPALMVTDRWLIISFSPQAARLNHELLITNDETDAPVSP